MKSMKCPVCRKGALVSVDDILSQIDGWSFVERGRRCGTCGEEFVDPDDSDRTVKVARRLGIWGEPLKLHRKLSTSGRGLVLRIPEDLRTSLRLKGSESVILSRAGPRRVLIEIEG